MLNKIKNRFATRLALASILAVLGIAITIPDRASAQTGQGYATTTTVLTTSSGTVASGTSTIISSTFTPNTVSGFAVAPAVVMNGTGAANTILNFQTSVDGVNWSSGYVLSCTFALTGTVPYVGYYDFPPHTRGPAWRT